MNKPRNWVIALPREDMEQCIQVGTFGSKRSYLVNKVRAGDRIACYITKEYKIIALGEATSDYYVDDKPVFRKEGFFIDRFDFRTDNRKEVSFMEVIDQMSFITNLAYWSVYFRTGIVEASDSDWVVLRRLMEKST